MKPDIAIADGENWPCFVGSGECKTPAAFFTDDGSGEYVCVCAYHKAEFDRLEKRISELSGEKVSQLEKAVSDAHGETTSPGRIELKLMGCLAAFLMLSSCAMPTPAPVRAPSLMQLPAPRVASIRSLVVIQQVVHSNSIALGWDPSPSPSATGYRLYYHPGTNGAFMFLAGIAQGTSCVIPTTIQLVSTPTNPLRIRTFSWDGKSYTNVSQFSFTMTATNAAGIESVACAPAVWPLPPPPANAIELNWGRPTNVTVYSTPDLRSWTVLTNVVGSNVVVPFSKLNQFFRLMAPAPALTNTARAVHQ